MEMEFCKGFTVYKNGPGPVFACVHTGPSFETPTSRDDNSDTVASLCWLRMNGSLVFSNITRKTLVGIDFNREAPPLKLALDYYRLFMSDIKRERLKRYRDRYAWVASSEQDYRRRLSIYNNFWSTIRLLGNFVVFIHRSFTRMKNYPSIMDVITFQGRGIKKRTAEEILKGINRKYGPFFKSIESRYKNSIIEEQKNILNMLEEKFNSIEPSKINAEFRENLLNDLKVMKRYASKKVISKLDKKFTKANFMLAVKNALKKMPSPHITVESVHSGRLSLGPKKHIVGFNKATVLIESNKFINYWHPNEAARIIINMAEKIQDEENRI